MEKTLKILCQQLSNLLFPESARKGDLSSNQKSDVVHIATAIHHAAEGFITSDDRILRKRQILLSKFSLDVVGVAEFVELSEAPTDGPRQGLRSTLSGEAIQLFDLQESQRTEVHNFLLQIGISDGLTQLAISPGASGSLRRRIQVRTLPSSRLVAFASWDAPNRLKEQIEIYVFVDEDYQGSIQVADYILGKILGDMAGIGPMMLCLQGRGGHSQVSQAAMAHGFRLAGDRKGSSDKLMKVCVGGIVDSSNWDRIRNRIERVSGVGLPESLPLFTGPGTPIAIRKSDGSAFNIALQELESLLGPVIILLPGRDGIVVPIRRNYSDDLLGISPQSSLLPLKEAALFRDRVYYSPRRTNSVFEPSLPLLFYESLKSGGRGSVIACARTLQSRIMWKEGVSQKEKRKGVLDRNAITTMGKGDLISVTAFDNIIPLRRAVGLALLRKFGAVDGTNAVTSRRIGFEKVRLVLDEGDASA